MIEPGATSVRPMADELVGRGYHSGSLLLPNGKILMFGNDPLYSDKDNTMSGKFEQRLELYTPPQLYKSAQPKLSKIENAKVQRGQTLTFKTSDATSIKTARLIPPSTTTHVTNVEQRSVAAVVKTDAQNGQISISIPLDEAILPNGWYMLFVTNTNGTPSRAQMIHIGA